ncbi:MAG: Type secretion system domain protein [Thermoleophilia bacterium]|nr:Type secretion system domain protein [Thermoleophilia bacterium]
MVGVTDAAGCGVTNALQVTDRWSRIDRAVEHVLERLGRARSCDARLADALRIVAASLRAGGSLPQSLGRVADRGDDATARAFGSAASRIALGRPIEVEVDRLAERLGTPAARLFAQVVRVQHRRGGDLATPCHRLAGLLHERIRLDAESRSATAQARFSARAVLAIPVLLAVAAAWRAPTATAALLQPGALLLAAPGVTLILAGALLARRVANGALRAGGVEVTIQRDGRSARSGMRRLAGTGPRSGASLRLACVAAACCIPALFFAGPSATTIATTIAGVSAAAAWPWSDRARQQRRHRAVGASGIETLLEVTIALAAAGATAHELATIAPGEAPEPLRSALAPAVHRVGLGMTIPVAFAGLEVVEQSPQLDGWLHAICAAAELGAPTGDVLAQLLRDARAARREQLRSIAQTAGPRMQLALVLLVVPGVMWLMLLATVGGLVRQLQAGGVM